MRIGIVLHDFALGGTERIAVRLANAWAASGATVSIFAGSGEGPLRTLVAAGVTCRSPATPIPRGRGSRRRLGIGFAADLARHPVDVAFIPGNFHWPVIAAVARLPHRPAIVAQISAALRKPQRGPIRQRTFDWRMRRLLGQAQAIVALDAGSAARAGRLLRRAVAALPLPALDDQGAAPVPLPEGVPLIVGAGRLVPEKGFDLLIEAVARMERSDARLAIAGDGPERARLKGLIADRGLDARVTLEGYLADIRPLLDRARLFVLSSDFEGYAAVVVEALAAGRPVVATDCTPATVELLGASDHGRVVPLRDPAAMAQAIDAMLAAPPPDPALLAQSVAKHRIGPVAAAYLRLFEEVRR